MNTKTTYDMVHLADDEWDNDTMQRVAEEWFQDHPDCQFVYVHEHAGWFLGYRRDLSIWCTANDMARCEGTRPDTFSGVSLRRQWLKEQLVADAVARLEAA